MAHDYHARIGDFANVFKAFIGTNYLSLPYGFMISGLGLALVGLLIVAAFTDYSCLIMVKSKHLIIDKLCREYCDVKDQSAKEKLEDKITLLRSRMMRFLDYGDLVNLTWGKWGVYVVNFCIIVTQAGFCMNYFIVIGNTMQTLFPLKEENITDLVTPGKLDPSLNSSQQLLRSTIGNHLPNLQSNSYFSAQISSTNNPQVEESTLKWNVSTESTLIPHAVVTAASVKNVTEAEYLTLWESDSWPLSILVMLPLPVMVCFSLFRTMRQLSVVSVIANSCLCLGFLGALVYLLIDFRLSSGLQWCIPSGLLIYIGQATGAFEAAALILPIEASMVGNHHNFRPYLHRALALMTTIIVAMATIGYLRFGPDTKQIILLNLPPGGAFTISINVMLIIAILCTYPLQIIPVVQIVENAMFGEKKSNSTPSSGTFEGSVKEETTPLMSSCATDVDDLEHVEVADPFELSIAYHVPISIPTWKRNTVRTLITLAVCGMAVLLRNVVAYSMALIGSLGSCPLGYIIPGLLYFKVHYPQMTRTEVLLNVVIIVFGTFFCIVGVVLAMKHILEKA